MEMVLGKKLPSQLAEQSSRLAWTGSSPNPTDPESPQVGRSMCNIAGAIPMWQVLWPPKRAMHPHECTCNMEVSWSPQSDT